MAACCNVAVPSRRFNAYVLLVLPDMIQILGHDGTQSLELQMFPWKAIRLKLGKHKSSYMFNLV
jgi:hypothetical protein